MGTEAHEVILVQVSSHILSISRATSRIGIRLRQDVGRTISHADTATSRWDMKVE